MRGESTCRCLICSIETSLTKQLAERDRQECYREFAGSRSLLSLFPTASDLVAYLHRCRDVKSTTHPADNLLSELLQAAASDGDLAPLREMLLLAFIPALHSVSRRVATCYPSLPAEDIAQHAVVSLLETLHCPEFHSRTSHVAFSISRILKRNTFAWAYRECRSQSNGASLDAISEPLPSHDASEPIERLAVLRHLLSRCQLRGWLTDQDLELLVHLKLEDVGDAPPCGSAAQYSNASRQRMKRIVGKLRRIARTRPRKNTDHGQGSLF